MDDVHKQLSEDLSKLFIWIQQSKMQLNTGKSSVMWFRPCSMVHHTPPDVAINGTSLQNVDTQKYLGITFTHQLDWSEHVATVCKKMPFYLFWINSHRKSLPSGFIKMLSIL